MKYSVGDQVLILGMDKIGTILTVEEEGAYWSNTKSYKVAVEYYTGEVIFMFLDEDSLQPYSTNTNKCECGSNSVPAYKGHHAYWCPLASKS